MLLLQKISDLTPVGHAEHTSVQEALATVKDITDSANEHKRAVENVTKLLEIEAAHKRNGPTSFNLISADRELLCQKIIGFADDLKKMTSPEQFTVYLFNDMLLWTHKGTFKGHNLTTKPHSPLPTRTAQSHLPVQTITF